MTQQTVVRWATLMFDARHLRKMKKPHTTLLMSVVLVVTMPVPLVMEIGKLKVLQLSRVEMIGKPTFRPPLLPAVGNHSPMTLAITSRACP